MRLLRAVHVLPGLQSLRSQEVIYRVHDGLRRITQKHARACEINAVE